MVCGQNVRSRSRRAGGRDEYAVVDWCPFTVFGGHISVRPVLRGFNRVYRGTKLLTGYEQIRGNAYDARNRH